MSVLCSRVTCCVCRLFLKHSRLTYLPPFHLWQTAPRSGMLAEMGMRVCRWPLWHGSSVKLAHIRNVPYPSTQNWHFPGCRSRCWVTACHRPEFGARPLCRLSGRAGEERHQTCCYLQPTALHQQLLESNLGQGVGASSWDSHRCTVHEKSVDCNENSADAMWAVDFSALTIWAFFYLFNFFFSFYRKAV